MYRPSGASACGQSFPSFPDREMGVGGGVGRARYHAISQPFPSFSLV